MRPSSVVAFDRAFAETCMGPAWSRSRFACERRRDDALGGSAAPGAAHALADALGAVDGAAGGHEAAHAAGEGREASAVGAAAAEIAGADDLAVAPRVQAGRLCPRLGSREGGKAAGD